MNFDLATYSEDAKKEGFCMLYTGGSKAKWAKVCMNPKKVLHTVPESKNRQTVHIGFLAYPNPKLKNKIPNLRFYEFNKSIVHNNLKELILRPSKLEYSTAGKLEQSVSKSEYIETIRKIKELLAAGEIYQLNYAIRFRKKFSGNPYHIFLKLAETSPSNFSAYLNCGDFHYLDIKTNSWAQLKN